MEREKVIHKINIFTNHHFSPVFTHIYLTSGKISFSELAQYMSRMGIHCHRFLVFLMITECVLDITIISLIVDHYLSWDGKLNKCQYRHILMIFLFII